MDKKILAIKKDFAPRNVSTDQAKDTGMAMVLICLLLSVMAEKQQFFWIAILCLLIDMTWPNFYKPFAKIWLGLAHLLGTFMSKGILSLLFIVFVVPMGGFRRLLGKDSLHLKKWKKGQESVFHVRSHTFGSEDVKHPY